MKISDSARLSTRGVDFHCIQTDASSINSHADTHTLIFSLSLSGFSVLSEFNLQPNSTGKKHGGGAVFVERDPNKQGHSVSA